MTCPATDETRGGQILLNFNVENEPSNYMSQLSLEVLFETYYGVI